MSRFTRVAVMGTGTMGPGMGAVLARAGMQVTMYDTSAEALEPVVHAWIDLARAEEARQRAEQLLKDRPAGGDVEQALASLRRAQIRVAVAQKRGGRRADMPSVKPSGESRE